MHADREARAPGDDAALDRIFAALADPTRRDIVVRLSLGDAGVGELAAPYGMSLQAVSKHLNVLEAAGLITRGREGRRRLVHLEQEPFELLTAWIETYRRRVEQPMGRLEAVLEQIGPTEEERHD